MPTSSAQQSIPTVQYFEYSPIVIISTRHTYVNSGMGHISGGAASGIGFGVALFILVTVSLILWWRRVHRDHFSKDPNTWGGSWGVKAMRETQARMDAENDAKYVKHLRQLEDQDFEMACVQSRRDMNGNNHNSTNARHGVPEEIGDGDADGGVTRPQRVARA